MKTVVEPGIFQQASTRNVFLLGILLFALLVHASYFNNGFVWLDHGDLAEGNVERARALLPLETLHQAFAEPFGETGFYRPLTTVSLSLDRAVYGSWAPGYHATNILLHALIVAALFVFARGFFYQSQTVALWAMLLFAAHPISWLPVGAIAYRPELLASLFLLLALTFYAACRRRQFERWGQVRVWICLLAFTAAMLSKETALPFFAGSVLVWEFLVWRERPDEVDRSWRSKTLFLALALVAGGYLAQRVRTVGWWHLAAPELPWSEALGTRLLVLGQRLLEWILPTVPSLSDAVLPVPWFNPGALASLLALLGFAVLAWRAVQDGHKSIRLLVLFLAVAIFPAANIVPLPRFTSPHYGYFAALGFVTLWASMLEHLLHRRANLGRPLAWGTALWLIVAAASTFIGGFAFRDDLSLFGPQVARDQNFAEGHYYLGSHHHKARDLDRAASSYQAALDVPPGVLAYVDRPALLLNFAAVRFEQERYADAEELFIAAQAVASREAQFLILYQRALIAEKQKNPAKVIELLGSHPQAERWRQPAQLLQRARVELAMGHPGDS